MTQKVVYTFSNFKEAIATLFECYWALLLTYPQQSVSIWYVFQRYIYELRSEFDKISGMTETLLQQLRDIQLPDKSLETNLSK